MRLIRALPLLFWLTWSCHAQNGPTQPSVILGWTQSTNTGVTGNCVYRGTVSGTYTMPAIMCSTAPVVTYTDATVQRGSTYYYAITAKVGAAESGYSNEVKAVIPTIAPPTGAAGQETKLEPPTLGQPKDDIVIAGGRMRGHYYKVTTDLDPPVLTAKVVWTRRDK